METAPLSSRTLVLVGVFAATLQAIANAPAALAPALAGFSTAGVRYEDARGTLWRGSLNGVVARGYSLGAIDFELAPLSLFAGAASLRFRMTGGAVEGDGRAHLGFFGGEEISKARLLLNLGAARRYAFLAEPLDGFVRAEIGRLAFSKEGCAAGEARLVTDVLSAPAQRFGAEGFDLAGPVRCESGDFIADLSGAGEAGGVSLSIRISPSMRYQVTARAEPANEDVAVALEAFGFEKNGVELTIAADGFIGRGG